MIVSKKSLTDFSFSFIIPRRTTESSEENLSRIHRFAKEENILYEVIVSSGNSATIQRNRSSDLAKNNYLYFLDNDSLLDSNTLKLIISFIKKKKNSHEEVDVLGGPALLQLPAPFLQKAIAASLGCKAVVAEVASRYASLGKPRACNEKNLILCNMVVRRAVFYELKKFYEMLYPAEEVDFVMRANRLGKKVYYHPDMIIRRPQRTTYGKYVYQMFNYGVGRSEMTRLVPLNFDLFFIFPGIVIAIFLLLLFVLAIFQPLILGWLILMIIFLYTLYLIFVFIKVLRVGFVALLVPVIVATCHVCYGLGILWGFLKRNYAANLRNEKLQVERVFDGGMPFKKGKIKNKKRNIK